MWILILLLFVKPVMACPAGTIENEGVCADMQAPETAPSVQPSDEKPPRDPNGECVYGTTHCVEKIVVSTPTAK